jgi:peroxiredoxin
MKKIFTLILLFVAYVSYAQEIAAKKPEYIFIVNDSIYTMEQVRDNIKPDDIKAMHKGVSDEEMKRLTEKFGDKVGNDKRFILMITLLTEEEKKLKNSQPKTTKRTAQPLDEGYKLNVNDKAADFTVQMLRGKRIRLSDLKGKVVLVNFWATWCGPCMMEFHEIPSKIIAPFKDKEFVFLAISRGEESHLVAQTMADLKKKGIDFNVGLDPNKYIWDKYGSAGIPKNYLIDQNGVIRYVSTGYGQHKVDQLAKEIQKLLDNIANP